MPSNIRHDVLAVLLYTHKLQRSSSVYQFSVQLQHLLHNQHHHMCYFYDIKNTLKRNFSQMAFPEIKKFTQQLLEIPAYSEDR